MREKAHKKITETVLDLLGANDIKDNIICAICKKEINSGNYSISQIGLICDDCNEKYKYAFEEW